MIKKISRRIPRFKNDEEAAIFWETHDSTDYLDDLAPAHLEFPKPKHLLITLKPKQLVTLKDIASRQGTRSAILVQKWITEKLNKFVLAKQN